MGGGVPSAEVVVYFADEPRRLYQLRQWLPVFEWLDRRRRVLLVTRDAGSFHALGRLTGLARVLAEGLPELAGLYAGGGFKVVVYVNNSARNFQSLAARQLLHVHVNHGESDKSCMVSNQVKAYDRVFVAGRRRWTGTVAGCSSWIQASWCWWGGRNSTSRAPRCCCCRRRGGPPCCTPRLGKGNTPETGTPRWIGTAWRSSAPRWPCPGSG